MEAKGAITNITNLDMAHSEKSECHLQTERPKTSIKSYSENSSEKSGNKNLLSEMKHFFSGFIRRRNMSEKRIGYLEDG